MPRDLDELATTSVPYLAASIVLLSSKVVKSGMKTIIFLLFPMSKSLTCIRGQNISKRKENINRPWFKTVNCHKLMYAERARIETPRVCYS